VTSLLPFFAAALSLALGGGTDRMYVQNGSSCFTLDPLTGEVLDEKPLWPLILNRGLIYDEGNLYFFDQNVFIQRDRLMKLNPATGRTAEVGPTGYSINQVGAFTKDPTTGQFYLTFGDRVFTMDKSTGKISFLTALKVGNPPAWIDQLAIDSQGRVFGISQPGALHPRSRLFRVDLQTGALTELGSLDEGLGVFRTIAFDRTDVLWGTYTHFSNPFVQILYKIDIQTLKLSVPFDLPNGAVGIAFGPPPRVTSYCTAKKNSAGCVPAIAWIGYPSVSASCGFEVKCSSVINNSTGMLIVGTGGRATTPFQGGVLCVGSPWIHAQPIQAGGTPPPTVDCSGVWSLDVNEFLYFSLQLPPGSVIDCQWWGRDAGIAPPNASQLSNALEVVVFP